MSLVEINKNPSPRELRWFGLIVLAFGGFVSAILYARFRWPVASWIPLAALSVVQPKTL